MSKKLILLVVILVTAVLGFIIISKLSKQNQKQIQTAQPQTQSQSLSVISTKPDPLENITILSTQSIEVTFSKPVFISRLDLQIEPKINIELEPVNPISANTSTTYRVNFKEPLALGQGYTLHILGDTRTEDGKVIDHEYIYHFKTISYKGV